MELAQAMWGSGRIQASGFLKLDRIEVRLAKTPVACDATDASVKISGRKSRIRLDRNMNLVTILAWTDHYM